MIWDMQIPKKEIVDVIDQQYWNSGFKFADQDESSKEITIEIVWDFFRIPTMHERELLDQFPTSL